MNTFITSTLLLTTSLAGPLVNFGISSILPSDQESTYSNTKPWIIDASVELHLSNVLSYTYIRSTHGKATLEGIIDNATNLVGLGDKTDIYYSHFMKFNVELYGGYTCYAGSGLEHHVSYTESDGFLESLKLFDTNNWKLTHLAGFYWGKTRVQNHIYIKNSDLNNPFNSSIYLGKMIFI
jgi:hypothetical protein